MSLTKRELSENLSIKCGLSNKVASQAVNSLLEIMKSTLASGEDILISGFRKFCVNEKSFRKGRNPQTGNAIVLDARRVVNFKVSPVLRRKLNGWV